MFEMEERVFEFEYNGTTYYYNRVREADNVIVEKDKDGKDKFIGKFKCGRCNGQGYSTWRRSNGICYECRGLGYSKYILLTTKNKSTAERRIVAKKEKKEAERDENYKKMLATNMEKTIAKYGESFYLVLDTIEYSTYKSRDYLKSKGVWWNPDWMCWWIKSIGNEEDFKDFQTYKIAVSDVLNEYNRIDDMKIRSVVLKYLDWLETKKGRVIV